MEIHLPQLLGSLMAIGCRVSGIVMFAPFLGHAVIPARIKAGLAVMLTILLYPVFSSRVIAVTPNQWPFVIGTELLLGIAFGIAANLIFEAAQMAGQVLSVQMGYSLVNILDPQTQVDTTVLSVFHQTILMLIFLALNAHHWILRAMAHSFDYLPPGTASLDGNFVSATLHAAGAVLKIGLQISAPVLAATIAADILLGLLSKASPQMPLIFLGPAIKGLFGIALLSAALHYWPDLFSRLLTQSMSLAENLLRVAK